MIARERIEVVIGGVLLAVPAGGVLHPAIEESWRISSKLERAIAQGIIADDKPEPRAEPAKRAKKTESEKDADE